MSNELVNHCLVVLFEDGPLEVKDPAFKFARAIYGDEPGRCQFTRQRNLRTNSFRNFTHKHVIWSFEPTAEELAIVSRALPEAIHTFLEGQHD